MGGGFFVCLFFRYCLSLSIMQGFGALLFEHPSILKSLLLERRYIFMVLFCILGQEALKKTLKNNGLPPFPLVIICFFLIMNIVRNVHHLLSFYGIVLHFIHPSPKIIHFQYLNIFKLLKQSCTVSFRCWIMIFVISLPHKSKYFSNEDMCQNIF